MSRGIRNNPINRSDEEEIEFLRQRRERRNEAQRQRRLRQRNVTVDASRAVIEIIEHYLGQMNISCTHCDVKHFKDEKANKGMSFNDCCSHGKVKLQHDKFPQFLKDLLNDEHENSDFFTNIRYYNNSLSFASFNANLRNFNDRRPGPYCFIVHEQIYYQINTSL